MTMCRPLQPPDLRVGERVADFAASDGWIHAMAIDNTTVRGRRFVFVSDEKVVVEWELSETGEATKRAVYVGHDHRVTSLCIGPDGSLFTGCWDNFVRMFARPSMLQEEADPEREIVPQLRSSLSLYHPGVFVLSVVILETVLYSGCGDGRVWKWDLLTEECIAKMAGHAGPIVTMCVKEGTLFTGSEDTQVRWWDLSTGSCLGVLEMLNPAVSVSAGPRQLLVAAGKKIHVFCLEKMNQVQTIDAHYAAVKVVLAGADGRIYSAAVDRTVRQFSELGKEQVRFRGHADPVSCLALCDGWLLSCAQDHTCIIWLDNSRVGVDHLPNQRLDHVICEPLASANYFNDNTSSPIPRQP